MTFVTITGSLALVLSLFVEPLLAGDSNKNGKIDAGEEINWDVPYS